MKWSGLTPPGHGHHQFCSSMDSAGPWRDVAQLLPLSQQLLPWPCLMCSGVLVARAAEINYPPNKSWHSQYSWCRWAPGEPRAVCWAPSVGLCRDAAGPGGLRPFGGSPLPWSQRLSSLAKQRAVNPPQVCSTVSWLLNLDQHMCNELRGLSPQPGGLLGSPAAAKQRVWG